VQRKQRLPDLTNKEKEEGLQKLEVERVRDWRKKGLKWRSQLSAQRSQPPQGAEQQGRPGYLGCRSWVCLPCAAFW
jgi:hypothetical protein